MHAWVAEAVARPGRTLLGLTGAPGAGKSTLAVTLEGYAERLVPGSSVVVGMDGWHLAHSVLVARGLADRKGASDTFDAAGYADTLRRLAGQTEESVWVPQFRREIEDAVAGAIEVRPEHRLVITEGNYLLVDAGPWRRVREYLDACWYVEAGDELRLQRLAARHRQFGRTAEEAEHRARVVDEANAVLIARSRPRADAVVAPD
jgi:pantothenate kinase